MNNALSTKEIYGSLKHEKLMTPFARILAYVTTVLGIAVTTVLIAVMFEESKAILGGGVVIFFFFCGLCVTIKDIIRDMLILLSWRKSLKAGDLSIYEAYPTAIKPRGILPTARLQLEFGEGITRESRYRSRDFYVFGNRKSIQVVYSPSCDKVFLLRTRV